MSSAPFADAHASASTAHRETQQLDQAAALCRTANFTRRYLESTVLHNAGLSWTSYDILHLTVMYRPIDTGAVAALASVSKGTVTRAAAALIKRGLVRRTVPSGDHRRVVLAPTSTGWALNQQLRSQLIAALARLLEADPNTTSKHVVLLRHHVVRTALPEDRRRTGGSAP